MYGLDVPQTLGHSITLVQADQKCGWLYMGAGDGDSSICFMLGNVTRTQSNIANSRRSMIALTAKSLSRTEPGYSRRRRLDEGHDPRIQFDRQF